MATVDDTGPTVFQRLAQIRANLAQILADTKHLRDAISVPAEEGDARDQAIDLRLQLDHAAHNLEELSDDRFGLYAPEPDHIDQAVPAQIVPVTGGQND